MASIFNPKILEIRHQVYKPVGWIINKIYTVTFNKWFYQLKASKHFDEITLQRILLYKFQALLPNHTAIYYDKNISHKNIKKLKSKPDFLLWKNDYTEWYVIEVELINHSVNHIDIQLKNFYEGDYSDVDGITDYVNSKVKTMFNQISFKEMLINTQPKIMLISDRIHPTWYDEFQKYECYFATLQIYVDDDENFLYRIGGEFPQEYSTFTYCNFDKRIRALEIDNGNFFKNAGYNSGDKVKIYYRFEFEEWRFMEYGDKSYLEYLEDIPPLDMTIKRYKVILNSKKQIHLVK
ncbi:hypothetical protein ACFO3U_12325 [Flavobacterium ponti]|uniref:Uncharacterized protein n=1 Tax=Flavobacterium ponti TaxID=665133 RepID=A0ABV9P7P7_9FLAO